MVWLFSWPNLPFLLPLGFAIGLVFIDLVLGGFDFGLDADVDLDVDVDLDLDVDVDADVDADVGGHSLLEFLGVGKAPLSFLLTCMMVGFGATGLVLHLLVTGVSAWALAVSVPSSAVVAVLFTHFFGSLYAAVVPGDETTTLSPRAFVGQVGTAASRVSANAGQVRLELESKVTLNVRRSANLAADIPRGTEVLVVAYDAGRNLYTVTPSQE